MYDCVCAFFCGVAMCFKSVARLLFLLRDSNDRHDAFSHESVVFVICYWLRFFFSFRFF